ncbi:MAG: DegT/DnrJ/EryC1/StrS family aminotransferase [bacterium]
MMRIQRTFPPTAAPLTWWEVMEGLHGWFSEKRASERLRKELCNYFGVTDCWLVSSGKAALTLILKALHTLSPEKKSVLIPAYTCYSVASSVVKAGLSVSLGEIDVQTLDFDYSLLKSQLTGQTLCIVVNHLLGRLADLDHCLDLARSKGIWVVEDAAQAMGISYPADSAQVEKNVRKPGQGESTQEKPGQGCCALRKAAGTRADVGFFSLGRGKVICTVEGGIIVTRNPDLAAALQREYQKLPPYSWQEKVILVAKAMALACFLRPSLYWLPDHLPFLKLGQTEFSTGFSLKRMSGFQCGLMRRWRRKMIHMNQARLERARLYQRLIRSMPSPLGLIDTMPSTVKTVDAMPAGVKPVNPMSIPLPAAGIKPVNAISSPLQAIATEESASLPFLRFPLIMKDPHQRDRLYQQARHLGLGISRMYPDSIDGIDQLQGQVIRGNFPAAHKLAQTLLTLPTHCFIAQKDQKRIIRLVTRAVTE